MHIRLASLALAATLSALAVSASAATVTTIMTGLNSPRGLAVGPDGSVYVAESGSGGSIEVTVGGSTFLLGHSGSVSRFRKGVQERVVTGLPSLVGPNGVMGPTSVAVQGNGVGFVTIGLGGDPSVRTEFPAQLRSFASLLRFTAQGKWAVEADLGDHEEMFNPEPSHVDTNPYSVIAAMGRLFVTDAGGNSLLEVGANGSISTVAVFEPRWIELFGGPFPMDAVPTSVAVGPDGALYVSQLTGFPFPNGGANIYRVAAGQAPTVYAGGFTTVIDLEFDRSGNLYVLEYAVPGFSLPSGRLIQVRPDGTREVLLSDLSDVTAMALGKNGEIYLSSGAFSMGNGVVLKVVL